MTLVCAIKPLCSWNIEETATTCRERCGGQGYLSVNRFGSLLGFAHAGMTAEGDNRWGTGAGAGVRGFRRAGRRGAQGYVQSVRGMVPEPGFQLNLALQHF